jgi:enoyl-[acyl-carrier protein] reductase III
MGKIKMQKFKDSGYWGLILGGSSGIGLASAQKLAAEGMNLCLIYRGRRAEARTAQEAFEQMRLDHGVQVLGLNLDATKATSIEESLAQLSDAMGEKGRVRLLLHAVAKGNLKPLVERDPKSLDAIEDEALAAHYRAILPQTGQIKQTLASQDFQMTIYNMALSLLDWLQALHHQELFAADARVLGLTSEGNQKALTNYAAVSAAKLTLESLIRSIAMEYAAFGIRANVLQPGITDTPSLRLIPGSQALKANAISRNPFGRLTTPEDVANMVYLMCLDESSWINGTLIPVDGGERLG